MLGSWTKSSFGALIAGAVALTAVSTITPAEARNRNYRPTAHNAGHAVASAYAYRSRHAVRYARRGSLRRWAGVLQCVPFARENSGIELTGNARNWWENAEGLYERGARPEVGSILNFRASGRMRLGHVAVVTNVIDSRHIEIDHANWSGPGRISRDIDVVDVSPANDWTAVRVAIGESEQDFGSTYPTYGFIYDRPDSGTMVANSGVATSNHAIHATPETLEAAGVQTAPEEVAEAADDGVPTRTYGSRHHRATRYHMSNRLRPHAHLATRSQGTRFASRYSANVTPHHRHRS